MGPTEASLDATVWAIGLPAIAFGLVAFNVRLANRRLAAWCGRRRIVIVRKRTRWLRAGPYRFAVSNARVPYRLQLRSPDATERSGWAAVPVSWFGWDDTVDLRYDQEVGRSSPGRPVDSAW